MPLAIDPTHRQFFHTHGWVQFDEALGPKSLEGFALMSASSQESDASAERTRDLHLKEAWARKAAIEAGHIAAGLWNERPLVLLGDQLLYGPAPKTWLSLVQEGDKAPTLALASRLAAMAQAPISQQKGLALDQLWSAQPLLGALIFALKDPSVARQETQEPAIASLPLGSVICLKANMGAIAPPVVGQVLWMVVFGAQNARYVKCAGDPFADSYRRRGVPEEGRLMLARPLVVAR